MTHYKLPNLHTPKLTLIVHMVVPNTHCPAKRLAIESGMTPTATAKLARVSERRNM